MTRILSNRRPCMVSLTAVAAILLFSPSLSFATVAVAGVLEAIDSDGIVSGWTFNQNDPAALIPVRIYVDRPAGKGHPLREISANIPRLDLPNPGANGFRFPIPSRYRDGKRHKLYVYGIDRSGASNENVLLNGAPLSFTLSSTVVHLDNGVIRVGLEPRCGGTLVELRVKGKNLINNSDCTGRQVQVALYDGGAKYDMCAACNDVWGWNPVQGGDRYEFGSPVVSMDVSSNSAYIATRPYEWHPDDKGGGPGKPVSSDVLIEQWISFMPGTSYGVHARYRVTHLGSDTHANASQEFPAVYVNDGFNSVIYYRGTAPWTNGPVSREALPPPGQRPQERYASERWASLVDKHGAGLTVYVPQQYPYVSGIRFRGSSGEYGYAANYWRALFPFSFGPNSILEGDVFLIAGDYTAARRAIYGLKEIINFDVLPPFGVLDIPKKDEKVRGPIAVAGWTLDNKAISRIDVLIDGTIAGSAAYGISRPDVGSTYPNVSSSIGFTYNLDTTHYENGLHEIVIRSIDAAGNVAILPKTSILIDNTPDSDGVDGAAGRNQDRPDSVPPE